MGIVHKSPSPSHKQKISMAYTQADTLLNNAYATLGLSGASPADKYASIQSIISELAMVHTATPVTQGTTSAISERLCKLGLEQVKAERPEFTYRNFGKDWKWIGDILVSGDPYDIAVSVKSYKAKERLLASGTGSLLTPTIGWGLFNDVSEWSAKRSASYLYRGFVAIYMPATTLCRIASPARAITNINGRPLLRDLVDFPSNLLSSVASRNGSIDYRNL